MDNTLSALNAYARVADMSRQVSTDTQAGAAGADFASSVKEALGEVRQTGLETETKMADFAEGKANVVDVVTAVAEAEVALETMVSVRDRVIQSYEEIMRMPI